MTGNGIESDFVLPDSLFISDYNTLPAFYPHFGANCRFFCTISMSPDSSTPFASRTRGAASGLRQRVFDPLDSLFAIELVTSAYNARVLIGKR